MTKCCWIINYHELRLHWRPCSCRTVTGESQERRNGMEGGDTGKDNLSNLTVLLKTSPAQSNLEKYKC